MREIAIGAGCVLALVAGLALLGKAFDASTGESSHALELAQVRAEASAAKAEADQARAEVERLKEELKRATQEQERLKARLTERETPARKPSK